MPSSSREYLLHILDEAQYLLRSSRDLNRETFLADETLKRAFVRSIEIIGEATKQIPDEMRDKYPRVEWRAMAGMRDRLIHAYFSIDYDIVWDVIVHEIPKLVVESQRILAAEFGTSAENGGE